MALVTQLNLCARNSQKKIGKCFVRRDLRKRPKKLNRLMPHRFFSMMRKKLRVSSYILSTAPPENSKDPVVENYGHLLKKNSERVKWAGYLSTTSVYGDKKGEWVTEDTELEPNHSPFLSP